MTKKSDDNKPPQLFYFIILVFVILVGLNFAGDYNLREQGIDDPQVQANQDNIDFLLLQANGTRNFQSAIGEILIKQGNRIVNNTDSITSLWQYDRTITTQIGDIKTDIKNKFPMAADVPDKQKSSGSSTPFLTLKMDKTEFALGNTVIFTGTAEPTKPVLLQFKLPDRTLFQIGIATAQIINGEYSANYTLRLDDPTGTWTVFAKQKQEQTRPITFKVE